MMVMDDGWWMMMMMMMMMIPGCFSEGLFSIILSTLGGWDTWQETFRCSFGAAPADRDRAGWVRLGRFRVRAGVGGTGRRSVIWVGWVGCAKWAFILLTRGNSKLEWLFILLTRGNLKFKFPLVSRIKAHSTQFLINQKLIKIMKNVLKSTKN